MAGIAHINQNLAGSVLPSLTTPSIAQAILKTCQLSALTLELIKHQLYQYRKLSDFFRLVVATSYGFKVGSRSGPLNKLLNPAHFVRWTAAPLQMCGFASQNLTTHLQSHIRRLARR